MIETLTQTDTCKELGFLNAEERQEEIVLCPLTRTEIESMLMNGGIRRNSRSLKDYSLAKKIAVKGEFINSDHYDQIIKWICEYVGI